MSLVGVQHCVGNYSTVWPALEGWSRLLAQPSPAQCVHTWHMGAVVGPARLMLPGDASATYNHVIVPPDGSWALLQPRMLLLFIYF